MKKLKVLFILSGLWVTMVFSQTLQSNEKNTIAIFKRMSPFVVNVHQVTEVPLTFWRSQAVATGAGSGFIWNSEGYVVTNYHVVENAKKLAVTTHDGKTVFARLIGVDRRRDIAVLKINDLSVLPDQVKKQQYFTLSESRSLAVGQEAIAIGSPFGLSNTLTEGVVSAVNREVVGQDLGISADLVQTDASINPGNSGGPLLNSQGDLIGMNTMIYSSNGGSNGIGFAVPSNAIDSAVTQIIATQQSIRQVGLGIVPLTGMNLAPNQGILIAKLIPGSPAARAGLKASTVALSGEVIPGDRIVSLNGADITSVASFFQKIQRRRSGDLVRLGLIRNQQRYEVKLRLASII